MLSWLWSKPPLATREKAWVETRLHWLADHLGIGRMLHAKLVLPTSDFFPGIPPATPEDAQLLMQQLCGYLGTDPICLQIEDSGHECSTACGQGHAECHSEEVLRVSSTLFAQPETLIAMLAQKLSRGVLLRCDAIDSQGPELERLADLLVTYLGFGVIAANTAMQRGLLPTRMSGYALALFAWLREEHKPAWADHLGPDAMATFRAGLRYLQKTDDSLFRMSTVRCRFGALSVNELTQQLKAGTPSAKIGALWELATKGPAAADAVSFVIEMLRATQADFRAEAARTLGAIGSAAEEALLGLTDALHDLDDGVRASAAGALGRWAEQPEAVVPELTQALSDESVRVVREAALALGRFGPVAEGAQPNLLRALRGALVDCDETRAQILAAAVRAITPDAAAQVERFFEDQDADLRHLARELFEQPAAD